MPDVFDRRAVIQQVVEGCRARPQAQLADRPALDISAAGRAQLAIEPQVHRMGAVGALAGGVAPDLQRPVESVRTYKLRVREDCTSLAGGPRWSWKGF